jgi:hypothetical protein
MKMARTTPPPRRSDEGDTSSNDKHSVGSRKQVQVGCFISDRSTVPLASSIAPIRTSHLTFIAKLRTMRFKAKLATDQVNLLYNVISPISKLQDSYKGAVVYLDPEFIRISCKSESSITCFAELSKDIFLDYRIEAAADNVIVLQVDLLSFKLALQSVVYQSSSSKAARTSNNISAVQSLLGQQQVTLKLAKRNNLPCLCLDGMAVDAVEIHQAIPVRILRSSEMQYHLPPQINTPNVQLELPLDRPLRGVVEKLKAMGPYGTWSVRVNEQQHL